MMRVPTVRICLGLREEDCCCKNYGCISCFLLYRSLQEFCIINLNKILVAFNITHMFLNHRFVAGQLESLCLKLQVSEFGSLSFAPECRLKTQQLSGPSSFHSRDCTPRRISINTLNFLRPRLEIGTLLLTHMGNQPKQINCSSPLSKEWRCIC